ncbi:sulfatase family protein [Neolewinella antarctica]|uniref:Arylsulfatase A-like enzyme n=1 Tax=Neolewinella antarctica TaxID=442734 RepID=A0ABX0XGM8_9BACT|nr:sulfatase-like hydrolase/transferase [Neolewinella antarctica]NJC28033.1 arylsulfatase A-like enzyme [Neolewinella antarctica]
MKPITLLSILLCVCSCTAPKSSSSASETPPNVLLIVVDDQGYADFSPFDNYEGAAHTTSMARLAESGTVYSQAYVTAPVCSPSRVGLLTGKNQFRWDGPASWGPGLPESVKTMAEYLREAGYATARIGKNDLGRNFHAAFDKREYPLRHGYDEFLGFNAHAHDFWLHSAEMRDRTPDPSGTSAVLGPLLHNEGEKSYDEGYLTDILTDEAISYLNDGKRKEKPFFLTLSYNAVHHLIHEVPQKYLDMYGAPAIPNYDPADSLAFGKQVTGSYSAYYDKYSRVGDISEGPLRNYYLANIHCLDDNIGRLLDALETSGMDQNTLVVFISDNGGSPLTGASNAPLAGGKYSLWEGGIRVPMAVSWPGHVAAGAHEKRMVSALDVLPTVAKAAGITLADATLDGRLLSEPDSDRLLVWKWQQTWAVRRGEYKLTNSNENHWKSRPSAQYIAPISDSLNLKLFNVDTDPGERDDLAASMPAKVEELEAAYRDWCAANLQKY